MNIKNLIKEKTIVNMKSKIVNMKSKVDKLDSLVNEKDSLEVLSDLYSFIVDLPIDSHCKNDMAVELLTQNSNEDLFKIKNSEISEDNSSFKFSDKNLSVSFSIFNREINVIDLSRDVNYEYEKKNSKDTHAENKIMYNLIKAYIDKQSFRSLREVANERFINLSTITFLKNYNKYKKMFNEDYLEQCNDLILSHESREEFHHKSLIETREYISNSACLESLKQSGWNINIRNLRGNLI